MSTWDTQKPSKCNSALSFHTFPTDFKTRRKWIYAIRRDHFAVSPHTRVCSRHFTNEDVREPLSETARWLRKGAVPALFEWNNLSLPLSRQTGVSGVYQGAECVNETVLVLMGAS
uniref:THAP domain-containing protein 1 n=1 Tax=Labrus bergylta TaxID=56723 RepID=A0A3Q3G1S8_9LABR